MPITDPRTLVASGKVDTTGAILSAAGTAFTVVRNGPGNYTLTLGPGLTPVVDSNEVDGYASNTAGLFINSVTGGGVTRSVIISTAAGVATDSKWSFTIYNTNPRV